jgi:hypothetical protein
MEFRGYWLIRCPDLRRRSVDGITDAQDLRAWIGGIAPGAAKIETRLGTRLEVAYQDMNGSM